MVCSRSQLLELLPLNSPSLSHEFMIRIMSMEVSNHLRLTLYDI